MCRIPPSLIHCSLLVLALAVISCSVLDPVGGAISKGYENTVSYFNAYYNAERLFGEAEDEAITFRLAQRGQPVTPGTPAQALPGNTRTKFTQVIDKCSSILSFHETSALVDDALLLIGKSYFYQAEYLKAERKFEELLAQYPDGPLTMETELWLLRSYAKNGKREEGLQLGEVLFAAATEAGEDDMAGQALLVMAELERADDPERCMQHLSQAVRLLDDDLECGTAQAQLADILRSLGRNEEAAEAYLTVPDITSDTYIRFYAIVSAARTYGSMKRYEDALELVEELLDDYSFAPHWNEIRFEVAEAKERLGWLDQALVDFEYIDTTAARTEFGTRSAFRRGWILEHSYGDYPGAQVAYARASAFTVAGVTPMAKQRENALSRHAALHRQILVIDSILAAPPAEVPDSVTKARPAPNPDSLRTQKTKAEFGLAELFYSDLEVPDSAVHYYRKVLAAPADTGRTPRVLYIMADLSRTQNLGLSPDSLYGVIMRDYPNSPYALASQDALGIPRPQTVEDPARALYAEAERVLEQGSYEEAIASFEQIIELHPTSDYAARSRYAIGWIYEYVLALPDSALSQYKSLVADYGSSSFASRVRPKVAPEEVAPAAVPDSVTAPKPTTTPIEKRRTEEQETPPSPESRRGQATQTPAAVPPKPTPIKDDD